MDSEVWKITQLAKRIPCLPDFAKNPERWNALQLDEWAIAPISSGERYAAQFVLAVWDPNHPWKAGKFDIMEALRSWDSTTHAVFLEWAAEPWWV